MNLTYSNLQAQWNQMRWDGMGWPDQITRFLCIIDEMRWKEMRWHRISFEGMQRASRPCTPPGVCNAAKPDLGCPRCWCWRIDLANPCNPTPLHVTPPHLTTGFQAEYGVVAPETVVYTEGDPLDREADPSFNPSEIGYDDIGGLGKQIGQVHIRSD